MYENKAIKNKQGVVIKSSGGCAFTVPTVARLLELDVQTVSNFFNYRVICADEMLLTPSMLERITRYFAHKFESEAIELYSEITTKGTRAYMFDYAGLDINEYPTQHQQPDTLARCDFFTVSRIMALNNQSKMYSNYGLIRSGVPYLTTMEQGMSVYKFHRAAYLKTFGVSKIQLPTRM